MQRLPAPKPFQRFGMLTVIIPDGRMKSGKQSNRIGVLCTCACDKKLVAVLLTELLSGGTVSCGCWRRQVGRFNGRLRRQHGQSKAANGGKPTPEYKAWCSMKDRCYNPRIQSYPHYGGRGIKVCDRWLESFSNFYSDLGPKPSPEHSLDRIDVDGDYCPENCRWASPTEQANNKRHNVYVSYQGKRMTIMQASRLCGIRYVTLYQRFSKGVRGDALFRPIKGQQPAHLIPYNGKLVPRAVAARLSGISIHTIEARIHRGWPPERLLEETKQTKSNRKFRAWLEEIGVLD
jgi:hypothetical protein